MWELGILNISQKEIRGMLLEAFPELFRWCADGNLFTNDDYKAL
jgi:hypothetical protein